MGINLRQKPLYFLFPYVTRCYGILLHKKMFESPNPEMGRDPYRYPNRRI